MVYYIYHKYETEIFKMRMRVLTQTSKGKMLAIADRLTKLIDADKDTDVIMPAYPCDGERLIIIVASAKASMPDSFTRFLRTITRNNTANIAFVIDGSKENAKKIVDMVKDSGCNIIADNILYIKGGLPFKFAKSVSPEETAAVENWVSEIKNSLA